ncbi:hypothetical protein N7520_010814 [Penicillium odoratum]|uniref:uncharacterized protein n=1 Tax=Penicillium odoratum TaxID=1167516 RepID=UPI002547F928|nr:uncharacterized protein N7520_010814 [Penicillium odoratum]KAJ5745632.1 hypothetical protein N7520_010814 [Penicillium odoratum]
MNSSSPKPENGTEQPAPFTINLLSLDDEDDLLQLLPASECTKNFDLRILSSDTFSDWMKKELDLERLHKIHTWLWIAGRPVPPRPLHTQLFLGRGISITERIDMHLVWTTGRMFLKPIPRFLLVPRFWACPISKDSRKCALGFLFSYVGLISYESDFRIAQDNHLLPPEVQWSDWRKLVAQILNAEDIYYDIDRRFYYGELRLNRLNKMYFLGMNNFRGYGLFWDQYSSFLQDNFSYLAGSTVYIAIVLTAMQVGLATHALADNNAFQQASYGFTVLPILGPLVLATIVGFAFVYIFIQNGIYTVKKRNKRLKHIGDPACEG